MTLLTDILTTFAASSIAYVGEVDVDGERMRTATNPRYVVTRVGIASLGSDSPLPHTSLGVDEHTIEIQCWADGEESAERMRQAAIYSMRAACGNVAHCHVGGSVWDVSEDGSDGCTLTLSLGIHIPLAVPSLPTVLVSPYAAPSSSVSDFADTYATISTVLLEDTATVTGDNILEIGDD